MWLSTVVPPWARRAVTAALMLVLVSTTLAPPATAARLSIADARGDAIRAADITRLDVNNRVGKIRVAAQIPRFKPARTRLVNVVVRVRAKGVPATEYTLITTRAGSRVRATLWQVPFATEIPPGAQPVACPGLKVKWIKNRRAVAVIPRSCLVTTAKVRTGVYIERKNATRARQTDWAPGSFATLSRTVLQG